MKVLLYKISFYSYPGKSLKFNNCTAMDDNELRQVVREVSEDNGKTKKNTHMESDNAAKT